MKQKREKPFKLKNLLPRQIIYPFLLIWLYFVITSYYKKFPFTFNYLLNFFKIGSYHELPFSEVILSAIKNFSPFLLAILLFLVFFGIGSLISSPLKIKYESKEEKFLIQLGVGIGASSLFTLVMGLIGLLHGAIFWGLFIVFSPISALRLFDLIKDDLPWVLNLKRLLFFEKLFVFLIVFGLFFNLIFSLSPEIFFDSQHYQLALPLYWAMNSKIEPHPFMVQSYFPLNINMIYLIGILLKGEVLGKIIHYLFGLLSCLVIFTFGRRFFNRAVGIIGTAVFYSVPLVMFISWRSAMEFGLTFFEILCVFCLANYFFKKKVNWLILAGIFCGLAVGIKYTGIFCLISALGMIIINQRKSLMKVLFVFVMFCLSTCGIWYVKNFIETGNPVSPFFSKSIGFLKMRIMEDSPFKGDPPPVPFTISNYLFSPWKLTMGKLQQESYPGPVFLLLLPFLFLFKGGGRVVKLLVSYLLIYLLLWISVGRFYLRYFVPCLPVLSLLICYYFERSNIAGLIRFVISSLLVFSVFANILYAIGIGRFSHNPLSFVLGFENKKEYLSVQRPGYPCPYFSALDWANKNLPRDSKILFLGEIRGCYSERKFFTHTVGDYTPIVEYCRAVDDEDQLFKKLREMGFTHILLNLPEAMRLKGYDIFYWEGKDFEIFCKFWEKYIKKLHRSIAEVQLWDGKVASRFHPQWWENYIKNPLNYVYIYQITDTPHPPTYNFLLREEIYKKERWEKIKKIAEKF